MSGETAKISDEQRRREAFLRLKRDLQTANAPAPSKPQTVQTAPPPPIPPRQAPAHHGVAFSVREPMICEVCQQQVTKWLSYKPDTKTCICWDCGIKRQERMMRGEPG